MLTWGPHLVFISWHVLLLQYMLISAKTASPWTQNCCISNCYLCLYDIVYHDIFSLCCKMQKHMASLKKRAMDNLCSFCYYNGFWYHEDLLKYIQKEEYSKIKKCKNIETCVYTNQNTIYICVCACVRVMKNGSRQDHHLWRCI